MCEFTFDDYNVWKVFQQDWWTKIDSDPELTLANYPFKTWLLENKPDIAEDIDEMLANFIEFQNSIPTAGIIFFRRTEEGLSILSVKNNGRDKFGLTKGKYDQTDKNLLECAIREVKEETGIIVTPECLIRDSKKLLVSILLVGTVFYFVDVNEHPTIDGLAECESMSSAEISKVKWMNIKEIDGRRYESITKQLSMISSAFEGRKVF